MEWVKLDLASAAILKKEVDSILVMLAELGVTGVLSSNMSVSTGFSNQEHSPDALLAIIPLIHERIDELEQFYTENCDDERAILFEKERLRLRKALQLAINFTASSRTVVTDSSSISQRTPASSRAAPSVSTSMAQSVSNQSVKFGQQSTAPLDIRHLTTSKTNSPTNSSAPLQTSSANSVRSSGSQARSPTNANATRLSPKPTGPGIYAWENNVKGVKTRQPVSIEDVTYSPSPLPGFYTRDSNDKIETDMDRSRGPGLSSASLFSSPGSANAKFMDLQIILTPEEMTALAARKRANRPDGKLHKSQAASTSVHSTTPFIEPARISKELLRPGHPDRWV